MTDVEEPLPDWTPEELAVLRSASADSPGPNSLAATLAAVGTGTAIAGSAAVAKAGSAASAKWGGSVVGLKWLGGLLLGGAVVTSGFVLLREKDAPPVAVTEKPPVAAAIPSPSAKVEPDPAVTISELGPVAETKPAPTPEPRAETSARNAPAQPDISLEIAALDAARGALRTGHPETALGALDRYDRSFGKRGSLRVEATALRIEALERSGAHARAVTLANGFLARNPKSPYAARIRSLVGQSPGK